LIEVLFSLEGGRSERNIAPAVLMFSDKNLEWSVAIAAQSGLFCRHQNLFSSFVNKAKKAGVIFAV
jgi:hypothetical protein